METTTQIKWYKQLYTTLLARTQNRALQAREAALPPFFVKLQTTGETKPTFEMVVYPATTC